ncbi:hypothetical protein NN561_000020 [Cricetulus griseus]
MHRCRRRVQCAKPLRAFSPLDPKEGRALRVPPSPPPTPLPGLPRPFPLADLDHNYHPARITAISQPSDTYVELTLTEPFSLTPTLPMDASRSLSSLQPPGKCPKRVILPGGYNATLRVSGERLQFQVFIVTRFPSYPCYGKAENLPPWSKLDFPLRTAACGPRGPSGARKRRSSAASGGRAGATAARSPDSGWLNAQGRPWGSGLGGGVGEDLDSGFFVNLVSNLTAGDAHCPHLWVPDSRLGPSLAQRPVKGWGATDRLMLEPQTDVYEPWSRLATPFWGSCTLGTPTLTISGEEGCDRASARGARTLRAFIATKRIELVLWPFFSSELGRRLGAPAQAAVGAEERGEKTLPPRSAVPRTRAACRAERLPQPARARSQPEPHRSRAGPVLQVSAAMLAGRAVRTCALLALCLLGSRAQDFGPTRFICTSVPVDADMCAASVAAGGAEELRSSVLQLRETVLQQKETILSQKETIRELTTKLGRCESQSTLDAGPGEARSGGGRKQPGSGKNTMGDLSRTPAAETLSQLGQTLQSLKTRLENLEVRRVPGGRFSDAAGRRGWAVAGAPRQAAPAAAPGTAPRAFAHGAQGPGYTPNGVVSPTLVPPQQYSRLNSSSQTTSLKDLLQSKIDDLERQGLSRVNTLEAVSYTHLDVSNRQVYSPLLNRTCFPGSQPQEV